MSVVATACAESASGSLIDHIKKYYPLQTGDPPIFFYIANAELPAGATFKPSRSSTGDDCHGDIVGAKDKDLKKAFAPKNWGQYFVCDGSAVRSLTAADIADFLAKRTN